MAAKKSAGSTAWKIIVGILVALLVIVLIAEFAVRWFVSSQINDDFHETAQAEGVQVNEDPEVSFGGTPLLWGMLSGTISQMNMKTPSTLEVNGTEIKGQPAADVEVSDLHVQDQVAGQMRATTTVPDEFLLATFQKNIADQSGSENLGNMVVTDIRAVGETNVLKIEFAGGIARLSLKPEAVDGQLRLTAENTALFGFNLPDQASDAVSNALQNGMEEQVVGDMRVEDVFVDSGQLRLTVAGENIPLQDVGTQFTEMQQQAG